MTYDYIFYTNETFDPSREYTPFIDGYVDGAHMKEAYSGEVEAKTTLDALGALFNMFNIDHPSDYKGRSMSVGDAILLIGVDGTARQFACERVGWREVPPEVINLTKNRAWTTMDVYFKYKHVYETMRLTGRMDLFVPVVAAMEVSPELTWGGKL